MEKFTLLGTSGAVADGQRDNVSFVFRSQHDALPDDFFILVECGGSAAHKLAKLGIAYEQLEHIIITHTHTDHLYGLPGLIFSSIYRDQERTAPLHIYCPQEAVDVIGSFLDFFELRDERFFPIEIYGIPSEENAPVLENHHVIITATPVNHAPTIPTHGIKIFSKTSEKSLVYSSDTGYSERLIRFAAGVDILMHECAGLPGQAIPAIHSDTSQVGSVAAASHVKQLILLHLDTVLNDDPEQILVEVQKHFGGEISIASDFDTYKL